MITNNLLSAQRIGDEILIAYNDGQGTEWCYWFKKCMNNSLFTFYKVGYRSVVRTTCDTQGIKTDTDIVWLNVAGSDNIGPVGLENYADFVGGNHPLAYYYLDPDNNKKTAYFDGKQHSSSTSDGRHPDLVPTAYCDSFQVFADETELSSDMTSSCADVKVVVTNRLMLPPDARLTYEESLLILPLSSVLCYEHVTYHIQKNSINVSLVHEYVGGTGRKINAYYGMQSVFVGETSVLAVGKNDSLGNNDFTSPSVPNFYKSDVPGFSRFVEKKDVGYQSAHILPYGAGKHDYLNADSLIFVNSSQKNYHVLIRKPKLDITSALSYNWRGVYTWFKPAAINVELPIDNDDVLIYSGVIEGDDALYIDTKHAWSGSVQVTGLSQWQGLLFVQKDSGISVTRSGDLLVISSTSAASAVIRNRILGDVNGDGIIDIDDVNAVSAMILHLREIDLVADINGDGVVDTDDLNALINIILAQ